MFNKTFPRETTRLLNLFDSWVCKVYFPYKTADNNAENIADLTTDILESTCRSMKFYHSIPTLYPTAQLNAKKIPSHSKNAAIGNTKETYTHK